MPRRGGKSRRGSALLCLLLALPLYLHEPVRLGAIELDLRLEDRGHLSLILGRTETSFEGLRLSRHPRFPSMVFRGERSGRFIDKSPLALEAVDPGWHRLRVEADERGWTARLDGEAVARREEGRRPKG